MVDCPANQCYTELTAEWRPKGALVYTLDRGCLYEEEEEDKFDCSTVGNTEGYQRRGTDGWIQYRLKTLNLECLERCKDNQCNSGDFVELGEQLSAGKTVASCHHCNYIERDDGTADGDETCRDKANAPKACPSFATVSSASRGTNRPD